MDVSALSTSPSTPVVAATSGATEPAVAPEKIKRVDSSDVQAALQNIHKELGSTKNQLDFSIDEDTGRAIVKVIDPETKNVLAQYPGEEVIRIAQFLGKVTGLFVAQTA